MLFYVAHMLCVCGHMYFSCEHADFDFYHWYISLFNLRVYYLQSYKTAQINNILFFMILLLIHLESLVVLF